MHMFIGILYYIFNLYIKKQTLKYWYSESFCIFIIWIILCFILHFEPTVKKHYYVQLVMDRFRFLILPILCKGILIKNRPQNFEFRFLVREMKIASSSVKSNPGLQLNVKQS